MTVFARDAEQEAYALLHTEGIEALEARYPGLSGHLINKWAEKGLCRISFPEGCIKIRTFKKYAK